MPLRFPVLALGARGASLWRMGLYRYRSVILSAAVVAGLLIVQAYDAGWLTVFAVPGAN